MPVVVIGTLFVLSLPFWLSLAGQSDVAKMLCLVASLLTLLLTVLPCAAALPWFAGMAMATLSVRERLRRRRLA